MKDPTGRNTTLGQRRNLVVTPILHIERNKKVKEVYNVFHIYPVIKYIANEVSVEASENIHIIATYTAV